ncbi:MAG: YbfB/YjiJ family MFS transporter, partial [Paracoccaceae bacterium]
FLSAWMVSQSMSALSMALIWVLLGVCICLSPFVWKPVFAKFDNGVPLSVILTCIAIGSSIPMVSSGLGGLIVSATIFGISVFMAPRKNLPERLWAFSISLFTVVFAIAQTVGPYLAGVVGDIFDNIGVGLLLASFILLFGAVISLRQKRLDE